MTQEAITSNELDQPTRKRLLGHPYGQTATVRDWCLKVVELTVGNPQKKIEGKTQQTANETQVSNLGLDPVKGVGSVVLSAIGNASVSDSTIKDFVSTHDYGAFTKAAMAENKTAIVPQFSSRAAANQFYATHKTAYG